MRLFVVNCTGQNRVVNYRLDFTVDDLGRRISERLVPYKSITVPARQQMQFGGDLHITQLQEIVSQIERSCGAVSVDQMRTAKAQGVVRMLWSADKPVPLPVLKDVIDHNNGVLSDQGASRRRQLALVADAGLTQLVEHQVPKLEMEFEQVEEDPDLPGRLEEGISVRREPVRSKRAGGRKA